MLLPQLPTHLMLSDRSDTLALPIPPIQIAQATKLQVVYPPAAHSTTAKQIFLIGSAPIGGEVRVNGKPIRRSSAGNFAPSFPLILGENKFLIEYAGQAQTILVTRTAAQPEIPTNAFGKDSLYPNEPIARLPGELICLNAIAPANAKVTATIGSQKLNLLPEVTTAIADNLSVLTGKLDSQTLPGAYRGCLQSNQIGILGAPTYELQLPDGKTAKESAKGTIEILNPTTLKTIAVTAPVGVARTGSDSEFARLTPLPKGTIDRVTGKDGIWLRLDYGAWIKESETTVVSQSGVPVESVVRGVTSRSAQDWTEIVIPMQSAVPIQINQVGQTIQLTLHHTRSQASVQRLIENPIVSHVTWQQINPTTLQYTLHLKTIHAWGYKARYEGNLLILALKNPPDLIAKSNLKGIKILLDPGHGSSEDYGSRGSGGIPEKDVTIVVSKLLRDRLIKRGATVIMTREGDDDIGPNERAQLIAKTEPTIALSLHYNALPDDGNAETTQGVSAFWYQAQSQSLAQFLHDYVTKKLDRKSDNVFWNNLALTRPTVAPAVMIELGYMIHPEEYTWITDPVQQQRLADTLADGIELWLRSSQAK
jgi:N-acetylmuramoyl-L-alanine amidase